MQEKISEYKLKVIIYNTLHLLQRSYPYIQKHYESSSPGFGQSAKQLMNEIEAMIGKIKLLQGEEK